MTEYFEVSLIITDKSQTPIAKKLLTKFDLHKGRIPLT